MVSKTVFDVTLTEANNTPRATIFAFVPNHIHAHWIAEAAQVEPLQGAPVVVCPTLNPCDIHRVISFLTRLA
jgi:hypothetical protein